MSDNHYAHADMSASEHTSPRARRMGRRAFLGFAAALTAAGVGWLTRRRDSPDTTRPATGTEAPTSSQISEIPSQTTLKEQPAGSAADSPAGSASSPAASTTIESSDLPGIDEARDHLEEPEPADDTEPFDVSESVKIHEGAATAGVIAVGKAYLRTRPDEADPATLMTALGATDGDVVAAARRSRAGDFASGRTVNVDGWILSSSEARAAALIALACAEKC